MVQQDLIDRLNCDSKLLSDQSDVAGQKHIQDTMNSVNNRWINLTTTASEKHDNLQVC